MADAARVCDSIRAPRDAAPGITSGGRRRRRLPHAQGQGRQGCHHGGGAQKGAQDARTPRQAAAWAADAARHYRAAVVMAADAVRVMATPCVRPQTPQMRYAYV